MQHVNVAYSKKKKSLHHCRVHRVGPISFFGSLFMQHLTNFQIKLGGSRLTTFHPLRETPESIFLTIDVTKLPIPETN